MPNSWRVALLQWGIYPLDRILQDTRWKQRMAADGSVNRIGRTSGIPVCNKLLVKSLNSPATESFITIYPWKPNIRTLKKAPSTSSKKENLPQKSNSLSLPPNSDFNTGGKNLNKTLSSIKNEPSSTSESDLEQQLEALNITIEGKKEVKGDSEVLLLSDSGASGG